MEQRLKKFSIKFGLLCGIIVTATSTFNAVLGSVEKWQSVFMNKNVLVESSDIHLEQKITGGGDNITISKTILVAGEQPQPSVDFLEDITDDTPDTSKIQSLLYEKSPPPKTILWLFLWYLFIFVGALFTIKMYKMNKKHLDS
jgi:hypothetical protein